MVISALKKINMLLVVWSCIPRTPIRNKIQLLFKPLESTRYTELSFIYYYLKSILSSSSFCLDVSSPYILSYILSRNNKIIKTDIFIDEKKNIRESEKLNFEYQDALALTFKDNTFDFVYSISVIEHIYNGLSKSVNEMIRVTKPGGYIYISFPVSAKYQEEWLDSTIYSNQFMKDNKTFFQYRLDKTSLESFLKSLKNIIILEKQIYWERSNGTYNKMISKLKSTSGFNYLDYFKNAFLNFYYGFTLLKPSPEDFSNAKDYGNISILLKKTT